MATRVDDRTAEQKKTHIYLVTATDKFMSGWGGASGGASKVAWCCDTKEKLWKLLDWVNRRSDMKYLSYRYDGKWYPKAAHIHLYVVDDNHPALRA
jgi:hypothetical protein